MDRPAVIALTPPGPPEPALAIAACRAGARGFLDLEYARDPSAAAEALRRLEAFTSTPFGVKVGREGGPLLSRLVFDGARPPRLEWVLLAGGEHPHLRGWVAQCRRAGVQVLVEAVTLDEATLAEELGADGVVLKGHESGGRVGPETSFILLQRWHSRRIKDEGRRTNKDLSPSDSSFIPHPSSLPVWVQGGVGVNTAAACLAAGAAGVVLDAQLLLARESPLSGSARARVEAFDGSETLCLGERLGESYRIFSRPGCAAAEELAAEEERIHSAELSPDEKREAWRQTVRKLVGPGEGDVWLLGQDAAFASPLAERFVTTAGIIEAVARGARQNREAARRLRPLAEGAPLAVAHSTRYPILQGPMTRVSDTAAFAGAVAEAGALPFLALALLRRAEVEALLAETRDRLGDRPWGVGILGFVPPEVRAEQVSAIRAVKPPFALIAGGRPDQARELEKEGIATYLHVPSPGLLRMFLRDGARRFVFEGRECGGHVGPRTSFVLWEAMLEVLLAHLGPSGRGDDLHVVFAGGIHDGPSAAMVASLAAPLAERGVRLGVLMGTAYLFTWEAVATGAIVPRFQREALGCAETVLLQSGPGHAIRCVPTPYHQTFEGEKERLRRENRPPEEVARALEWMNIGRLRVASKGVDHAAEGGGGRFVSLPEDEQYARGMYMIGQVACLRDRVIGMAELHEEVCAGSVRVLEESAGVEVVEAEPREKPCDVAIIGMACFYPRAGSLRAYWENILAKVNAVTEVPPSHWDWRLYYDPDPRAPDKIVSKWGAFLDDVPFDPFVFGITPNSLPSIEPLQLLLLEGVRRALTDAGYSDRPFSRERTAAILGIGGGGSPLAVAYGFRTCLPLVDTIPGAPVRSAELMERATRVLPEWTEDSFPGILLNVAAGRVANRFNFGGPNFAIDAACGSSLAAVHLCVRELEAGTSDLAVAMGADTVQTPYAYMAFSKTHALSPRGQCRPFDASADGIVLSEGISAVVLKRLADAERDGDRVYAVIKGVGASSDGRDKGLTAPRAEGQLRALRRAYAKAGLPPSRVGLIEAHGTGTVVGDQTEAQALAEVFREAGAAAQSCALGSVKSMIGHSKCAAGLAGLIKTTLALHHKVLPPTLVEKPNPKGNFEEGPLFLNTEARPWVHGAEHPRTAGVSAFGFGGTNFHAVLEEYSGGYLDEPAPAVRHWPAELFVWRRATRQELVDSVAACRQALEKGARPDLGELAFSLWKACPAGAHLPTLAVVASGVEDLVEKLGHALEALRAGKEEVHDPRGVYFAEKVAGRSGKVAFLFPGQGSQYPNMLAQVTMVFDEVRRAFDEAERVLAGRLEKPLGKFVFPPSAFTPQREQEARKELTRTEVAQPALGAACLGMFRLLGALGVEPDLLGGHSYGEYVALCAAGCLAPDDLIRLSHARGRILAEATGGMPGGMAAVDAGAEDLARLLGGLEGVLVANSNSPAQTVISGTEEGLGAALARLKERGVRGQRIPVACGFHSPLVAPARAPLAEELGRYRFAPPARPVFSNAAAAPYPEGPAAVAALLAEHLTSPVRFREEVEAMYQAGARVFVEVGPQAILTGLVGQTLSGRPHLAAASDVKGRAGLVQLAHLLGQLLTAGVPVRLDRLFRGRDLRPFDLAALGPQTGKPALTPSTWMVNSIRNRPLNAPEPRLLGQTRTDDDKVTGRQGDKVKEAAQRTAPAPAQVPAGAAVNGAAPHPAALPAGHPDEAAQVMLRFQDLMAKFLDTQRSVMTSYLQGGSAPTLNGAGALPLPTAPPAPPAAAHPNGQAPAPAAEAAPANGEAESPPATPAASEGPRKDRDWLAAQLVDLVSKRTGYPREMLGLDLDLEADLGVDSIKRVEILGGLAESMGGDGATGELEMEKLTGIKTLRGILDYVTPLLEGTSPKDEGGRRKDEQRQTDAPASDSSFIPHPSSFGERQLEVQRALIRLVDAPLPASASLSLPAGAVLFTDDGRGVAGELAGRLADLGVRAALLRMGQPGQEDGRGEVFRADLTDERAVPGLLDRVREQVGPVAGLIHLLPLAEPPAGEDPAGRMRREVRSLYLLARGLEPDLRQAGGRGSAFLLAATGLGGSLGFGGGPLPESYFAGQGGVMGFVKCLGFEWPEVLVRVVDLDPGRPPAELAERLLAEAGDPEGPLEVGHAGSRRVTWEPVRAPLPRDGNGAPLLGPDSTVLITGGARGITAAVALELARRYKPNLVLVGRSPLPEEDEPADTAGLTEPGQIKSALIARSQREGRPAAPAAVEGAYRRLMQDREIRANLKRLREAGARAHYHALDVRDTEALGGLLDDVEKRFGGLDGVIHGAGVIEDRLVRDKTPESFDRVFATKTASALTLARRLRPERLKFLVLFASIASRYGNKGQSDYAAANEVLSKLAHQLDRVWPCRVVSVAWGPWSQVGMVADLEKHLSRRGLKLISPAEGPVHLVDELVYGRKGESEVVIAGGSERLARPAAPRRPGDRVTG